MKIMTRKMNENDKVKRYHVKQGLDIDEIRKVKAYIRFNTKLVTISDHANYKRQLKKMAYMIDINTIFKKGECFEIKMINNKLWRLSIRLYGNKKDYIYVLEPLLYDKECILLNIVSVYTNRKTDNHSTLDLSKYDSIC